MLQSAGRTFAHCAYWLLEQEQTRFGEVRRRPFRSSLNGESVRQRWRTPRPIDLQVMSELESMFPNDKDASYASPRLASPVAVSGRTADLSVRLLTVSRMRCLESGLFVCLRVCFCRASQHSQLAMLVSRHAVGPSARRPPPSVCSNSVDRWLQRRRVERRRGRQAVGEEEGAVGRAHRVDHCGKALEEEEKLDGRLASRLGQAEVARPASPQIEASSQRRCTLAACFDNVAAPSVVSCK